MSDPTSRISIWCHGDHDDVPTVRDRGVDDVFMDDLRAKLTDPNAVLEFLPDRVGGPAKLVPVRSISSINVTPIGGAS